MLAKGDKDKLTLRDSNIMLCTWLAELTQLINYNKNPFGADVATDSTFTKALYDCGIKLEAYNELITCCAQELVLAVKRQAASKKPK